MQKCSTFFVLFIQKHWCCSREVKIASSLLFVAVTLCRFSTETSPLCEASSYTVCVWSTRRAHKHQSVDDNGERTTRCRLSLRRRTLFPIGLRVGFFFLAFFGFWYILWNFRESTTNFHEHKCTWDQQISASWFEHWEERGGLQIPDHNNQADTSMDQIDHATIKLVRDREPLQEHHWIA